MYDKESSSTFADVDNADDPQFFVNCLNEQYTKDPFLRLNKQRTLELCNYDRDQVHLTMMSNIQRSLAANVLPE